MCLISPRRPLRAWLDQRHHDRVVAQQMPDHQDAAAVAGQLDQRVALEELQRQRLLDEDVLARGQGAPDMLAMQRGGRGDRHGVAFGIVQDGFEGLAGDGILAGGLGKGLGRDVGNGVQRVQAGQVAGDLLAPIAAADTRHACDGPGGDREPRESFGIVEWLGSGRAREPRPTSFAPLMQHVIYPRHLILGLPLSQRPRRRPVCVSPPLRMPRQPYRLMSRHEPQAPPAQSLEVIWTFGFFATAI